MKVFWSWQDDLPGNVNRHFIRSAIESAIQVVAGDFEIDDSERPQIDHDTKGLAGAIEIAPAILRKIAESAVFIADVTPVGKTGKGKALPNPNVMVELGWSLHKPGQVRQIYVLNTASGFGPADLPFDIRGRRILPYSLAAGADAKARESTKKRLAEALTHAIRSNLADHREEEASSASIQGVDAAPGDPSLWAGAANGFRHQDSFAGKHWRDVSVSAGRRVYMRIVPAGWRNRSPDVTDIAKLGAAVFPNAPTRESGGDFGPTNDGYVHYWTSNDEPRETSDLTMFFEETGEFWMVTGSPVYEVSNRPTVALAEVFGAWAKTLRRANHILDHFKAFPARRVEVGFANFEDVRFPGGWAEAMAKPARRSKMRFDRKLADWSPEAQRTFLIDALSEVFRLFAIEPMGADEAGKFVDANDFERNKPSPWQ